MNAFVRSFGYAWAGLRRGLLGQRNIRIQGVCFLLALGLAWGLEFSSVELALVLLSSGLVLCLELANCALESLADALCPQHCEGIGRAKDLMAGAVLLAALFAALIGALLYLPKLAKLWR